MPNTLRRARGFTLVEIMIVCIILLLLAAMAIPAFTKVRNASLLKAGDLGNTAGWTSETKARYRELRNARDKERGVVGRSSYEATPKEEVTPVVASTSFQSIEIDNKRYFLVPKQNVRETNIGDKTFWLVPAP